MIVARLYGNHEAKTAFKSLFNWKLQIPFVFRYVVVIYCGLLIFLYGLSNPVDKVGYCRVDAGCFWHCEAKSMVSDAIA